MKKIGSNRGPIISSPSLCSILFLLLVVDSLCAQTDFKKEIINVLKPHILAQAEWALKQTPLTVTSFIASRSAGGKHDFYSEGDYWWPDSANLNGPYIQRDGQTNPDNFIEHRRAMIKLSRIVGALASAYVLTENDQYVSHAFRHLKAWFADTATRMNPSLLYAQAIKGRATGRGIGIIDTIHLIEVAQGIRVMENAPVIDKKLVAVIKNWFAEYLHWLTTHPYGQDEMNAENNHGTCWIMQVASFSKLTGDVPLMALCKERFKTLVLPNQMAKDGSFPRELKRTKPYGYSLFNLDAISMLCQILSDQNDNLWQYRTKDNKSVQLGIEFLSPYIQAKELWPYGKDVMYWDNWPVAHPFLAFGAIAYKNTEWFTLWKLLDHSPETEEVVRNLPVRNPVIWLD